MAQLKRVSPGPVSGPGIRPDFSTGRGPRRRWKFGPARHPARNGAIGPERYLEQKPGEKPVKRLTNVTKPTLTVYRPAKDKDTGTAVLICPGGGYNILAWDLEGEEVAAWLNSLGVTGIILKYRVPRRPGEPEATSRRRPAPGRPAGRQPGPEQGQGVGHRPEADRHARLLGRRPPGRRDRDQLREADLRAGRRRSTR